MTESKKTRTRLSPEVRKNLILDHAAELVAVEGVSALSTLRHISPKTVYFKRA